MGRKNLPVADPDAEGIWDLIQPLAENTPRGIAAVQVEPAELQLRDIGDLPRIEIEIIVSLLLAILVALELLPGGVAIAKAGARAEPEGMTAMRRKIEVQQYGHRQKVFRQLILAVADRIHDHLRRVGNKTDILLITIVVELETKTIFQVDDMFDQVQPLHKDPDIYFH